ncbi:MAG: hypothetical protein VYA46_04395, partial [Verrucomicrobiota bacterium]|nr:hypothetical protein [Verrucomicrobiota bacterium]
MNRPMQTASALAAAGWLFPLLAAVAPAVPLPESTFKQDRFAVGAFWAEFPGGADLDARFREIADASFTLVFGPIEGCSPERLVELCQKHGLAALVHAGSGSLENLPAGEACWGYRVFDEPSKTMF